MVVGAGVVAVGVDVEMMIDCDVDGVIVDSGADDCEERNH